MTGGECGGSKILPSSVAHMLHAAIFKICSPDGCCDSCPLRQGFGNFFAVSGVVI